MIVLPAPVSSASRNRILGSGRRVPIDGLDLVRKRIDDARVDREEGVELVSDADALGLGAEEEKPGVAVERAVGREL
jgi:hypothetical protein